MNSWQEINKVVVVGLGITGLSVVNHIVKTQPNIDVKVIDTRAEPPAKDKLPTDIKLHSGSWNMAWLLDADLIVANPGIALHTPEIQQALKANIPVVGDIELFAWAVNKPVVAITGSNGKSTVTDLTGVMAKSIGLNVGVGGNIGVPALDLLEQNADLYVLELSSFQLETTSNLHLAAAAYLNLSEDHMDRYDGMNDYGQAKQRIFAHSQVAVVNRADKATWPNSDFAGDVVTFGDDDDANAFGLSTIDGVTYLSEHHQAIMPANQMSLVGKHNSTNALVAMALLKAAGIDYKKTLDSLKSYQGLTHRCQVVAYAKGVKWVNDSKATNVASTLAALSGLECRGQLHLLVGGDGKGADFSVLVSALSELPVQLHCFGHDGTQFMPLHPSAKRWDTMDQAMDYIASEVADEDIVMLSPACASFDQYPNFMARGDAFTALAQQYANLEV